MEGSDSQDANTQEGNATTLGLRKKEPARHFFVADAVQRPTRKDCRKLAAG
jgi:hypothetical protein